MVLMAYLWEGEQRNERCTQNRIRENFGVKNGVGMATLLTTVPTFAPTSIQE
jgi:hypothetical protein